MASLIDELVALLRMQADDFSDLAGLAEEKQDAIVKNDVAHLQTITNLENTLVGKTQKADRQRARLMNDIAAVLNAKPDGFTISRLTELLDGQPGRDALAAVGADLRQAADRLRTLNDQNRKLIGDSLEYIDFSMNLIRNSQVQPSFYSREGEETSGASPFFDAIQ